MTGTTASGFEFEMEDDLLKDVEFLEIFYAVQRGDTGAVFDLIGAALGKDQKKALYDHVRNGKGKVMIEDLTPELEDMFKALGENQATKN